MYKSGEGGGGGGCIECLFDVLRIKLWISVLILLL